MQGWPWEFCQRVPGLAFSLSRRPQGQGCVPSIWVPYSSHCVENICWERIALSMCLKDKQRVGGQDSASQGPDQDGRWRRLPGLTFSLGRFGVRTTAAFPCLKSWGSCCCRSHRPPQRENTADFWASPKSSTAAHMLLVGE